MPDHRRTHGIRRRVALVAAVLAIGISVAPPAVRPALAANGLRVVADATYTLDADAGRVRVAVDFELTNLKPSSGGFFYYWRDIPLPVQAEATSIRATDGSGNLGVSTRARRFYIEAEVRLRRDLLYQQTARFTLRYDLRGGAPRSDSPVRVGRAFATFGVWAWGDPGRGSVEVVMPQGFGSQIDGGPMEIRSEGGRQTLLAEPPDPGLFYAIVSAENRLAYGETRLSLEGDVEIVVRAWPEDDDWDATVSETLRLAMPELRELIGLPWPVDHDLTVRERYTPSLEGYAGVFFTDDERIDISEDLDPLVIVHEASHAWFNQELFTDRWIYEGLAQEYAWRVQSVVGGEAAGLPEHPGRDDPGHVVLNSWAFPEVIRDQETDDLERYGYEASFWVVHRIASTVGDERMRAAFAAADANLTAYPGAGAPETVPAADGWRRFLDLVESFERDDATDTERSFEEIVLRPNELRELAERREARESYSALVDAGRGWLAPWYIREQMGAWRFELATPRMEAAMAVLELRDRVDSAAEALDLEPTAALRTAYEGAIAGFDGATAIGEQQLAALAAIEDARERVEAPPDLIAQIGLLGETPRAPYDEARAQFEHGELDLALGSAAAAAAIVSGAAAAGQGRIFIGAAIALGVLLLVIALLVFARRRRRRPGAAFAFGTAGAAATATIVPDAHEPSATLAADPAPPPSSADPPEEEGA